MRRASTIVLVGVALSLAASPACSKGNGGGNGPTPPEVTDVVPPSGYTSADTAVTITGSGFAGTSSVALDDPVATMLTAVSVVSDTEIQAAVPAGIDPGYWNVQVTNPVGTNATSTPRFRVVGPPAVTDVAPASGLDNASTPVTITGTEFVGVLGVDLDDGAATALTAVTTVDDTTITASVPAGVAPGLYNVRVTTGGGTNPTSAVRFEVIAAPTPPPTVAAITPNTGPASFSTPVTIDGTNFIGTVQANLDDPASTQLAGVTVTSPTQLTATVPAGIAVGTWEVRVTADGGTSAIAGVTFEVTGAYTGPAVYVSSRDTDEVLIVDLSTMVLQGAIPVGRLPTDLAITPDETEIYVANSGGDTISVIETATNTVVDTIPVGAGPYAVDFTPVTGAEAYVANSASASVSVIDVANRTAGLPIALAANPAELEFRRPQGDEVWVLTAGNPDANLDPIQVIDTASQTVIAAIPDVGINPMGITFDQGGDRAYVVNSGFPPADLGDIKEISVATKTISRTTSAFFPVEIARIPGSDKAYFSDASASELFLFDTSTGTMLPGTIPLSGASPTFPGGRFAFAPGTNEAFALEGSGLPTLYSMYRIDTATDTTGSPVLTMAGMNAPPIGLVVKEK